MSIKHIHIFFIICSILLLTGFGWYLIKNDSVQHSSEKLFSGFFSFGLALGLSIYLTAFIKKMKHIEHGQ